MNPEEDARIRRLLALNWPLTDSEARYLTALLAEKERLERDFKTQLRKGTEELRAERDAALAGQERLKEALREIVIRKHSYDRCVEIARAALAGDAATEEQT